MIRIANLRQEDVGRSVVYKDRNNIDKIQHGRIKSWNDNWIFVWYHSGDTAAATSPDDLTWS